tara:strand:- start:662 stop:973 length:312 start_codon:yes stop_codon:yes gene_type:complete
MFNTCSEADAKESTTRSNAFDNIDKRDNKLFTKEERIKSYNNSVNKSESLKKSLKSNNSSGYSGYGSSTSKKQNVEKDPKKNKKVMTNSKTKVNLQFSAYSTN